MSLNFHVPRDTLIIPFPTWKEVFHFATNTAPSHLTIEFVSV